MKKTLWLVVTLWVIFPMPFAFLQDAMTSIPTPEVEQVTNNDWDDFCPVIDLDSAGNPHIAWATPKLGYYAYKSSGSWIIGPINTTPAMSGGGGNWIDLSLDSQDRPHIAWALPTPDPEIFYSYLDGDQWITEQVTDWDATEGAEVALALDSKDQPHIVWDSRYRGIWGIFYSKKTDSGWIPVESISHDDDAHPSIAIDKNDIPHVVWTAIRYFGQGQGLRHAYRVEGTWITQEVLPSPVGASTSGQHIAIDSLGNVHIVAVNEATSEILYIYKGDSLSVTPIGYGWRPSIALNANEMPYVAWSSDAPGVCDIYLAEYKQQWIVRDISNQPLDELRPNIAVDARGNIHLVWYGPHLGQGASEIYYSKIYGTVTATVDIDPDTLNLKSEGEWITAYIELPEGYAVSDVDVASIMLDDAIPVDVDAPVDIGDYDGDGVQDLMVKFNRAAVINLVKSLIDWSNPVRSKPYTYEVSLTVTGSLGDGSSFGGSDTIRALQFLKGDPKPL